MLFYSQASGKTVVTVQPAKVQDGEVQFNVWMDYSGHPVERELQNKEVVIAETTDKLFRLYLDLGSGQSLANSHYQHQAFVCEDKNGKQSCIPFTIFATPAGGQFSDSMREVDFSVEEDGKSHTGRWRIPVHSFSNVPVLAVGESIANPILVNVGSETTVKIVLKDLLPDSRIVVDEHPVLPDDNQLWKSAAVQPIQQDSKIIIGEGEADHVFDVKLKPNILDALSASVPPILEDKPHTTLTLVVVHEVEYGGHQRRLEIALPVRFVPSFWSLLLVVVLGSVLGIVFSFVLPGDTKSKVTWRTFVAGAAFSLVVEAACIVLVAGGSKLVIFKEEVNPSQLLTVFLIGFGTGLIVAWRSDVLRSWLDRLIQMPGGGVVPPKSNDP